MRIYSVMLAFATVISIGCSGDAPEARTPAGAFRGLHRDGVLQFLGIRYAAPPVGDLRWRAPVPLGFVEGLSDARAFGWTAPQLEDPEEGSSTTPMSEDCLFLNVFTPGLEGNRPVVLFIHGGGWVNGGTIDPWYYGAHLAERGDVVVVTIDYRLGPLGFLDLSRVGGSEYAASGNLGLLDQQVAMRWVHDNVAAFGGNPDDVTLVGQSAGAQSVAMHLALPESRRWFHKAVAMSGALGLLHSQATARATADRFMEIAGVTTVDELRALSWQQLMDTEWVLEGETFFSDLLFGPVLDGTVFTEPPARAIERGDAAGIPLLSGTTHDETRYWYYYVPYLATLSPRIGAPLLPPIANLFDAAGTEALIAGYETRHPELAPPDVTMAIATDALFRQTQIRLTEAHAAHEPRTFMYRFDWKTTVEGGLYGAPHAVDLPFLFHTFGEPSVDAFLGSRPSEALVTGYEQALLSFVRTGVPSVPGLPTWPAYDSTTRSTWIFDDVSRVENDPDAGDRAAWLAYPFDSVVPSL